MARYFGQTSPNELKELERNANRATSEQLAKAASYLEYAFSGQFYSWFGGWALRLRGSRRETRDLDLLVLARDVRDIRVTLAPYDWAILSYYEMTGSIQERMFVDIGQDGQLVGVDIVLSGRLDTPVLNEEESSELITPSFSTPQGEQVPVICLPWQVEGKLKTWMARKKESDFQDLAFLLQKYESSIKGWSEYLPQQGRREFYDVYKVFMDDKSKQKVMKRTLGL
ncbi:Ff.00g061280.m01.CDS01 [Fusarium sp. VM40]|nr:Ff.00g061280.m01.CDS01 [Fusarium sp. VM40]